MPRPSGARSAQQIHDKRTRLEAELEQLRAAETEHEERRAAVAGRVVLAQAAQDSRFREELTALLDRALSKKRERALFGLTVRQSKAPGSATPADESSRGSADTGDTAA